MECCFHDGGGTAPNYSNLLRRIILEYLLRGLKTSMLPSWWAATVGGVSVGDHIFRNTPSWTAQVTGQETCATAITDTNRGCGCLPPPGRFPAWRPRPASPPCALF